MSYNGFTTTAYFSETSVAPVTAAPLTMACWFNTANTTANQNLLTLQRGADTDYFGLTAAGSVGGDPINAYINGGGIGSVSTNTSTGFSANTWHHACAVFTSSTSRAVFIDGGSKGTSTTSRTPASLDRHRIGVYRAAAATGSDPLLGRIAEIGIWNVALTDAEVLSLARGMSPSRIRPQSLVRYRPFVRDTQCVRSAATLTATGAPTVAVHPRIYNST